MILYKNIDGYINYLNSLGLRCEPRDKLIYVNEEEENYDFSYKKFLIPLILEGTELNIIGHVKTSILQHNTSFNNLGDVTIESIYNKVIPTLTLFKNSGSVYADKVIKIEDNVIFYNNGNVFLNNVKEIGEETFFDNKGDVILTSLERITSNIYFVNDGNLDLDNVKRIEENVWFCNSGYVDLSSVEEIADNVIFSNDYWLKLGGIKQLTRELNIDCKYLFLPQVEKLDLKKIQYSYKLIAIFYKNGIFFNNDHIEHIKDKMI